MQAGRNLDCFKTLSISGCRIPTSKGTTAVSVINVIKANVGIGIAKLESLLVELPAEQIQCYQKPGTVTKTITLN